MVEFYKRVTFVIKYFSNRICKHIGKTPRANAITKALPKSLQSQRTERNCLKKFADT